MAPTVVLLGPPGSGKGAQGERLRDEQGYAVLATGDLLRKARAEGTDLGRQASDYIDRGDLVPDDVIVDVIRGALGPCDSHPVALDGFPRTVAQADALAGVLDEHGRELTSAILIDVPDETVVERISGRHQERTDDRPETVRERLRVYHRETEPLVRYYEARGLLRRVDGSPDVDTVAQGVREALG